jgi:predicted DNA-binding transcriptional regulator AlpA
MTTASYWVLQQERETIEELRKDGEAMPLKIDTSRIHTAVAMGGGIVGVAQCATICGVSQQRVHQWIDAGRFPDPLPGLVGRSKAWLREDVERWNTDQDG